MATRISTDPNENMSSENPISLMAVEDCHSRVDKFSRIFNSTETNMDDSVQLKMLMSQLEKLLTKEMKTWWDLTTLDNYIQKKDGAV